MPSYSLPTNLSLPSSPAPPLKPFPSSNMSHQSEIAPSSAESPPPDLSTSCTPPGSKHYTWVPANQPAPNNILLQIDTSSILPDSRRNHSAHAMSLLNPEPRSFDEATASPFREEWLEAIGVKLLNMKSCGVFSIVNAHPSQHPLSTMLVFCCKTNQDGNLTKFKARLCVQQFLQGYRQDYPEVFSPTGRLLFLCILLTICALRRYTVHQMDVNLLFLMALPRRICSSRFLKG